MRLGHDAWRLVEAVCLGENPASSIPALWRCNSNILTTPACMTTSTPFFLWKRNTTLSFPSHRAPIPGVRKSLRQSGNFVDSKVLGITKSSKGRNVRFENGLFPSPDQRHSRFLSPPLFSHRVLLLPPLLHFDAHNACACLPSQCRLPLLLPTTATARVGTRLCRSASRSPLSPTT